MRSQRLHRCSACNHFGERHDDDGCHVRGCSCQGFQREQYTPPTERGLGANRRSLGPRPER